MEEQLLRFDNEKTYCWIDFETENLCLVMKYNLPWQTGMMKARGETVSETYQAFAKWYRPLKVSDGAAKVTHYDAKRVEAEGVPYMDVVDKVVEWTSEADYIIGHNILGFDIYFLAEFYRMKGKPVHGLIDKIIDTHPLAKGFKINYLFDSKRSSLVEYQYRLIHTIAKGIKTSLTTLGQENKIEHDYTTLHEALNDLQLNKKIWDKIVKWQVEI